MPTAAWTTSPATTPAASMSCSPTAQCISFAALPLTALSGAPSGPSARGPAARSFRDLTTDPQTRDGMRYGLLLVLAGLLSGCGEQKRVTSHGKPVSHWVEV